MLTRGEGPNVHLSDFFCKRLLPKVSKNLGNRNVLRNKEAASYLFYLFVGDIYEVSGNVLVITTQLFVACRYTIVYRLLQN